MTEQSWPDAEPDWTPQSEDEIVETEWGTWVAMEYADGEIGWHCAVDRPGP